MTQIPDNLSNLSHTERKELLVGLLSKARRRVFPLSLAQQRLWFLDRLYPGNPAYNVSLGLHLRGNLNSSALQLSARELIKRHEILRTKFTTEEGQPVQVVEATSELDFTIVDLAGIPSGERLSELQRIGWEGARFAFNLATGPLIRLKLIRLDTDEHLLLCVMHHIVCDGWSLEIFVRELAALYDEYSGGPHSSLVDLPIQYGDYSVWQREFIEGNILIEQAQYWRQKLAGGSNYLNLPADRVRPPEQAFDGASQTIPVPKELVQKLTDLAHARRATLFMVMLTVFKTLLHIYSEADDISIGVPVGGRSRLELEGLIGFFVNTLVLRSNLSGDPRLGDLLFQVREVALEAFANADLPFEKLVEDLNPERTLSYSPLIQVMFSAIKARKFPNFGSVSVSPYIFDNGTSLFDLSMDFIEDAEGHWWLRVVYVTSLFDSTRMLKMLNDYLVLLAAAAERPELRISGLASLLKLEGDLGARNTLTRSYLRADRIEAIHLEPSSNGHLQKTGEPRNALERILVRIWERKLNASGIRIDDNFFDLGGHSLLAAQLISEIEKAVGRKIPVSVLFRSSTVASLAKAIQSDPDWSLDPLVMELNKGALECPLFAVVQSGVDALGYAIMARHMGRKHAFYKLQGHASFCHIVPFTIEEFRSIAREYIGAMRTIQPKGPYFLLGMCNGAHIAEQMVLELEAQGQDVGLLGIIDTLVLQRSEIRWLARLESFRRGRQSVATLSLSAQASHYTRVIKKRVRRVVSSEDEPENPFVKAVWPGNEFQIRRFRAPVVLFKRPKQPYFKVKDPTMGWGARSLSGVKLCIVNIGEHMEMLREPAVQVIADQLRGVEQDESFRCCATEAESITT